MNGWENGGDSMKIHSTSESYLDNEGTAACSLLLCTRGTNIGMGDGTWKNDLDTHENKNKMNGIAK